LVGLLFNLAAPLSILVFAGVICNAPQLLETPPGAFVDVASAFGRWIGELMIAALNLETTPT